MRANTFEAHQIVFGAGVAADEHARAEEGRNRIREDDLADDAFGLHVAHALGIVPVLVLLGSYVLLLRVLVRTAPFVEERLMFCVEVFAVALDGVAGVGVGGNDDDRIAHEMPFVS